MCGIFGIVSKEKINRLKLQTLVNHARQRGRDSSGLIHIDENQYSVNRADFDIKKLLKNIKPFDSALVLGHSRLITNGLNDNQPVVKDGIFVIHNGIIVNEESVWNKLQTKREFKIDSEAIAGIFLDQMRLGNDLNSAAKEVLNSCEGTISCAVVLPSLGKLILFSNNGSLYVDRINGDDYFSSESYPLEKIGCTNIKQVMTEPVVLDIPILKVADVVDFKSRTENLIPEYQYISAEDKLLETAKPDLIRCTKCILPHTMPFITFDEFGVCNYCNNYKLRNVPKPKEEILNLLQPYRRKNGLECIVPFSGGRDSCYSLHLIVNELNLRPVTYTYDWGMVTDLGRRNISRVCSKLRVENIIIAADISKKRKNIAVNLKAWLKSPHLGMVSIFTAGDKHFFRHVETVKKQTGVNLNLWGINPLEVTHFKSGFLGIKPDFEEKKVYSNGVMKQLNYQFLRFKAMLDSPGYFNSSIWDTISGEYYRSFTKKEDYFHVFDYWVWDEVAINQTLLGDYDWETAIDTNTTWRIGDGTAAFYNYIYHTVVGFTEHDTFRSNQIREGQISRKNALELVMDENQPRYQNIKWYLDTLGFDFIEVVKTINSIPKRY